MDASKHGTLPPDPTSDGRNAALHKRTEAFNQLPADRWDELEVIDLRDPVSV